MNPAPPPEDSPEVQGPPGDADRPAPGPGEERKTPQATGVDFRMVYAFVDNLWLQGNFSEHTINSYRIDLMRLAEWLGSRGLSLRSSRREDLLSYLQFRLELGLKANSNARLLSSTRRFYGWLVETGQLHESPASLIRSPRLGRPLPKSVSVEDMKRLLEAPVTSTLRGLRDRALLEIMYAAGLRVSELVQLRLTDIDHEQSCLRVLGKGRAERLAPFGESAEYWLQRYLKEARPLLLKQKNSPYAFLNNRSSAMSRQRCWQLIKGYAGAAGLDPNISPHRLRHAFATHLVDGGANLRAVQMLLGHKSLSTTQVYTAVTNRRLKSIQRRHHPRG